MPDSVVASLQQETHALAGSEVQATGRLLLWRSDDHDGAELTLRHTFDPECPFHAVETSHILAFEQTDEGTLCMTKAPSA
jgi:hypothetical protein